MARFQTKNKFLRKLINELADDGARAIHFAYTSRGFVNRSYNLHDSYGSAVFVNGSLYPETIRYVGNQMADSKKARELGNYSGERTWPNKYGERTYTGDTIYAEGRKEVDRFFLDYQSKGASKSGVELVIVAAMFYASILEGGRGTLRRKYQVISGATNLMGSLASKYGADLYVLDVWRNADQIGAGTFDIRGKTLIKSGRR